MKIPLWTIAAGAGLLTLAACGSDGSQIAPYLNTGTGSSAPSGSAPAGGTVPADFVQFVSQEVGSHPAFGIAPAMTTTLGDFELGTANAFASVSFGTPDALPAGTYQASVACAAAGTTACNPLVSADLNSTLN
jgi:hypothetical protein